MKKNRILAVVLGLAVSPIFAQGSFERNSFSLSFNVSSRAAGVEAAGSLTSLMAGFYGGGGVYKLYGDDPHDSAMGAKGFFGVGLYPIAYGGLEFFSEPKDHPKTLGSGLGLRAGGGYPMEFGHLTMTTGGFGAFRGGDHKKTFEVGLQVSFSF